MVFMQYKEKCAGCGKEHNVYFSSEKFKLELREYKKPMECSGFLQFQLLKKVAK